jgi:hypothetical protein
MTVFLLLLIDSSITSTINPIRHVYKNQYITDIPQNIPLWNTLIGLNEKPVRIKAAHTNRNGKAAVDNKMSDFFIK